MRAPHTFATQGRETTRAHARLDQVESTQSKQTSDISTTQTDITSNTTAINAINTGSGGTTHENFLGSLSKMPHIGAPSGSASHSGIGTISGTPTDTEFNALNTAYNNAADFMNGVATVLAGLLSELQSANYES